MKCNNQQKFDKMFNDTIISICGLYKDEVTIDMKNKIEFILKLLNHDSNNKSDNDKDLEDLIDSDDFWNLFN